MTVWKRITTLFVFLVLLIPLAASAQQAVSLTVNSTEVLEETDFLQLGVYFTLIDNNTGLPIDNAQIASVDFLQTDTTVRTDAGFKKADTPFYIVLVLDASGSMMRAGEELREAATGAVQDAPEGARFAVIRFNDQIDLLHDFTDSEEQTTRAISNVEPINLAGTCLYDAAYQAVEMLTQAPAGRRAVILFTDGKDETAEGDPCSYHTYQEVVDLATQRNLNVPIHTIGMAGSSQAVNATELENMASTTGGFSAIGSQGSISTLFDKIMTALNSQWLAQAQIYPTAGDHDIVITVQLRDGTTVTATAKFTSSKDYMTPPDPVSLAIEGLEFRQSEAQYLLHLRIVSPQLIHTLQVQIWDQDDGVLIDSYEYQSLTAESEFPLPTQNLVIGRDYDLRILPFDSSGREILNADGDPWLVESEFKYDPDQLETTVAIAAVTINGDQLLANMEVSGEQNIASYQGWLVSDDTKGMLEETKFTTGSQLEDSTIVIPMGDTPAGKYTLIIKALDAGGQVISSSEYRGIQYTPPKGLSGIAIAFQKIAVGLKANPWIIIAIVFIILLMVGFLMFLALRSRRETGTPVLEGRLEANLGQNQASGPINYTMYGAKPPPAQPKPVQPPQQQRPAQRISQPTSQPRPGQVSQPTAIGQPAPVRSASTPVYQVRITKTTNPANVNRAVLIQKMPFTIGREECTCNLDGDLRVSRQHAQITYDPSARTFLFTDLGSANGSWINGVSIPKNRPTPIQVGAVIGLGPDTKLVLEKN